MFKILTALIILIQFRAFSQPFSDEEKRILKLQDRRDASAIVSMYEDGELKNNTLVKRALTALANISDSSACKTIINIYKKTNNSEVKSLAAFALGQIPSLNSSGYLREIEKRENSDNFRRTGIIINTFNALGKIGNENDLERICKYTFKNDELNGALALSIARFGMRKIKSKASFEKLWELTYSLNDENQKKWVAYAFNRIGDKDWLNDYKKELEFLTTSENIFCRMWAISALGKTGDASYTEYIMSRYSSETDWRVKVNVLNTVGNLNPDENNLNENYFDMIMHSAVDDANPNVSVTACQNLAKICINLGKEHSYPVRLKEFFENYLQPGKVSEPAVTNEIILTLAKIFKEDYRSRLFELFSQKEEYSTKSAIVSAFQYMDDPLVYKELRDSISSEVQRYNLIHPNKDGSMIGSPDLAKLYRAFVETLSALDDKLDDENKNIIRLIFSEFASSKDPAITDISLTALTDSLYSKYRDETAQILLFDIEGFDEKNDKDVMIMYINTLGMLKSKQASEKLKKKIKSEDYDIAKAAADAVKQITGKDYMNDIEAPKIISNFDWNFLDKLNNKKIANILTEKGNIKIELFPNIAPFTVQSFVKLDEKGFYNSTVFHRVVPNFVIQGGDPTGTGYGGPGYSIRTEIADNTFDSYFLGMASSGKDTEGSQFFITQSPQPHLDGKYTIFGKVIEGFDVVDKIQVGDKIEYIVFSGN